MREQPVEVWLDELASEAPAPGGGSAAALSAAMGAALVAMVCQLTVGRPRYAEHAATMADALAEATELRETALRLAEDDAAAFGAVAEAYRLPKGTERERADRSAAIQAALADAADVPLRTAAVAADVIATAARVLPGANVNVLSDVAVAAATARAALDAASVNVTVNVAAMTDTDRGAALTAAVGHYAPALREADRIVAEVRQRIAG
ncbi:cyclodeaminase/cyclohydrolase family protein [Rhizomonospora bruguierae]|uniref:cyclodeaminase/cyclohydrolase family protein n=1 Tax=Rhizomonospora bruguierae TaxID=1581705 RepID=UPI001BCCBF28|nr:cyclodeaminase/cyclohydrolase family protein [Micromonospora sp. NBRC 107566]